MKVLVCGNPCEHEWPESCFRALERMGHEARLLYFEWPREGDFERYLPRSLHARVAELCDFREGRRSLLEVVFYNMCGTFRPDLILLAGMYHCWSKEALAQVSERFGIPVVLWSGDDPFEPGATDIFERSPFYDLVLYTIHGLAERTADRFQRTAFLPFACDPERDRPFSGPPERIAPYRCDVSYLGR